MESRRPPTCSNTFMYYKYQIHVRWLLAHLFYFCCNNAILLRVHVQIMHIFYLTPVIYTLVLKYTTTITSLLIQYCSDHTALTST